MHLLHGEYLLGLLLLPLIWAGEVYLHYWRRKRSAHFMEREFRLHLFPTFPQRRMLLKTLLWSLAFVLLVLALARPQGRPVQQKKKRVNKAIYFVVDCSLSMKAQDVYPNRLLAAKKTITAMIERLSYERAGIVVFAGDAQVACPATTDYASLKNALHYINTQQVSKVGSDPAAGVKLAMDKLKLLTGYGKMIVLLSDGEENQTNDLSELGQEAQDQGIKIVSVGIGSESGAVIPVGKDFWGKEQYKKYQGRLVKSHLQSLGMRKLAKRSQGVYLEFRSAKQAVPVMMGRLSSLAGTVKTKVLVQAYFEYFPWLVSAALALLLLEWLLPVAGRRGP